MTTRQTKATKAALQAAELVSQLLALSKREKWFDSKKADLETAFLELEVQIRDLDPMFAHLVKVESGVEVQPVQHRTVFVPVTQYIRNTCGGAQYFEMAGFVGGIRSDGRQRPNGGRCIPGSAVTVPYNHNTGVVGVDRKWLNQTENADLQVYLATFPPSVTQY